MENVMDKPQTKEPSKTVEQAQIRMFDAISEVSEVFLDMMNALKREQVEDRKKKKEVLAELLRGAGLETKV